MNEFTHGNFRLKTVPARRLYYESAAGLPIIDFHNHLDPAALADHAVTGFDSEVLRFLGPLVRAVSYENARRCLFPEGGQP